MNRRINLISLPRSLRGTLLALTSLAMWCGSAQAQNNSLLHGQRTRVATPVPASQPATDRPLSPAAGLGIRPVRFDPHDPADAPPPNTVLLGVSPFAVEQPRPQKVQVHDLVTVIIRETRTSLNDAKMDSNKDWQVQSEFARWFRLDTQDRLVPETFEASGKPGVDFSFRNDLKSKGKYDRKDELTMRITATVIDIKPNGNLVLEASKEVGTTSEEKIVATLTGVCRSADITAQNTVLSTQVADLRIEMRDTGAVRDATRRGWLMKFVDLVRPI